MIVSNNKEITQIYRDDSLVEYIYKGDRPIYDCMIDYVLNDDGTCYVNRAGQTNVARQENIEYLYIPNKICKNSRIYEVTQVGTRDGYNNKFRILKKALIGAPTDESGKMAIVDYGFEDRTSLEEVVITDSVFSIGKGAFLGCNKIAKMTLPPCPSRLDRIFGNQLNESTGKWVPQSLKTVTVHSNRETFKRLQDRFFYKCSYIETINIDIKNLESIGDNAFEGCPNLTNITIPDSVTSIGVGVFSGCDTLKYNEYNNGHYLGNDNNPYVALIKAKNTSISSCIINENTKVICPDAFEGCDNLQYNEYNNGHYLGSSNNLYVALIKAKDTSISSCTINKDTKIICPYAFYDCSGLTSVTIGNSVTSIGEWAFAYSGLTSVTIPDSVTSIGVGAFSDCDSLTSVTIGNSVTSISESAFYNCSDLTDVTIGNSVTSIGGAAFYGCNGLQSIYYTGDVASWCGITGLDNVMSLSSTLYIGGKKVEGDLVIPDSVTSIGSSSFYNCSGLTSVTIPDSVTSIGEWAFYHCYGITSITIPDSVTYIGNYAFHYCGGLKSVTIPNSVTSIGSWAFAYSGLTSVTIPDSVTSIGDSAFSGCDGLTSVIIGNSVPSIGNSAFRDCSGLTSVTIPDSVTSIGGSAFRDCSKLTSVTIPNRVTSIGRWAFTGSGLTSVTIPGSVTSIDELAFSFCSDLTDVTIGNSVTSIGKWAFRDCSGLTSVTMLPTNPPTLGSDAIPSNVTTITVPVGRGNTYKTAVGWRAYADKIVEATA